MHHHQAHALEALGNSLRLRPRGASVESVEDHGEDPPIISKQSHFKPKLDVEKLMDVDQLWVVEGRNRTISNEEFPKLMGHNTREQFDKLKPWRQKLLVTSLGEIPPYSYKFPHDKATPLENIEAVDWKSCVGVERSADGSEGVIFAAIPPKVPEGVVVKCPTDVFAELYGTLIADRLGLLTPSIRILRQSGIDDEDEMHIEAVQLVKAVTACDDRRPLGERCARDFFGNPFILVYEYIAGGKTLADMVDTDENLAALYVELFGHGNGGLSPDGRRRLQDIGKLVAYDTLICNMDRLPCLATHAGNPQNVMFTRENEIICIDSVGQILRDERTGQVGELAREYADRVGRLVENAARATKVGAEAREFARIRCFLETGNKIWNGLKKDIGEEGTLQIQEGFLQMVKTIVQMVADDFLTEILSECFELMKHDIDVDNHAPGEEGQTYGFDSTITDFVSMVRSAMEAGLQRAEEPEEPEEEEEEEAGAEADVIPEPHNPTARRIIPRTVPRIPLFRQESDMMQFEVEGGKLTTVTLGGRVHNVGAANMEDTAKVVGSMRKKSDNFFSIYKAKMLAKKWRKTAFEKGKERKASIASLPSDSSGKGDDASSGSSSSGELSGASSRGASSAAATEQEGLKEKYESLVKEHEQLKMQMRTKEEQLSGWLLRKEELGWWNPNGWRALALKS